MEHTSRITGGALRSLSQGQVSRRDKGYGQSQPHQETGDGRAEAIADEITRVWAGEAEAAIAGFSEEVAKSALTFAENAATVLPMNWIDYLTEIEREAARRHADTIKALQQARQQLRKRANKRMERAAQKARKEDQ